MGGGGTQRAKRWAAQCQRSGEMGSKAKGEAEGREQGERGCGRRRDGEMETGRREMGARP